MLKVADVIIKSVDLINIDYKENSKFKKSIDEVEVDILFNIGHKVNEKKKEAVVNASFEIFPSRKDTPLYLIVEYRGIFGVRKDVPIKNLKEFCEFNAPAMIFPYIRETIDSITCRSKFPRMTIPLINLYGSLRKPDEKIKKPPKKQTKKSTKNKPT